jgi:hypothetical protein
MPFEISEGPATEKETQPSAWLDKETGVKRYYKPKHMEQPPKPNCVCGYCADQYALLLQAYGDWQEEVYRYDEAEKLHAVTLMKKKQEQKKLQNSAVEDAQAWWAEKENKKSTGNAGNAPAVTVKKPILMASGALQKVQPTAGKSHSKGGKFGGVSKYTDADVAEARIYMNEVLELQELSINGRDLAHILAEVYAVGSIDTNKVKTQNAEFLQRIGVLEGTVKKLTKGLEQTSAQLEEAKKSGATIIKLDKEKVAELKTGRRIKE